MEELASIDPLPRLQALPGAGRGLLGLAGVRGRLVPVFDLGTLLTQAGGPQEPWWLAVVGREEPVGFAFPGLEAYLRVPTGALAPLGGPTANPWVKVCVQAGGLSRPVVELRALVDNLYNRSGLKAP